MKKTITLILLCVFHVLRAGSDDPELQYVKINTSESGWVIRVTPDGAVSAECGPMVSQMIFQRPGSIDFAALVKDIQIKSRRMTFRQKMNERYDGTIVTLVKEGESEGVRTAEELLDMPFLAIKDDQFLRELFTSDPEDWLGKNWLAGVPEPTEIQYRELSESERLFLERGPIYRAMTTGAEQDADDQLPARAESKAE